MANLIEMRKEYHAKQKALGDILAEAKEHDNDFMKIKSLEGDHRQRLDYITQKNNELTDIGMKIKSQIDFQAIQDKFLESQSEEREVNKPLPQSPEPSEDIKEKSITDMVMDGVRNKTLVNEGQYLEVPMSVKALFGRGLVTGAALGYQADDPRSATLIPYNHRPTSLLDMIPELATSQWQVSWDYEENWTSAAAPRKEADAAAESTESYQVESMRIRTVSDSMRATEEAIADSTLASLESRFNMNLRRRLMLKVEDHIINGDGTDANEQLKGIETYDKAVNLTAPTALDQILVVNQAGSIPPASAVLQAINRIYLYSWEMADGIVMHPLTWERFRLETTPSGEYLWGHPSTVGMYGLFGLPVIMNAGMAQDVAYIGAWQAWSRIYARQEVRIDVANTHDDDFLKFIRRYRAGVRLAFALWMPRAFCKVTFQPA